MDIDFDSSLIEIQNKVKDLNEDSSPVGCRHCAGLIHSKKIYGLWMDIFLLITNICSTAIIVSKGGEHKGVHELEYYLDQVNEVLDNDLIKENIPDLFKVGLDKYLSNYISRMNGVESLELVHSKILQIKGKV